MLVCGSAAAAWARLAQESPGASAEVPDEVKESERPLSERSARFGEDPRVGMAGVAGVPVREPMLLEMSAGTTSDFCPELKMPGKWACLKGKFGTS